MKLEQMMGAGAYVQVRKEADRLLLEGNLSALECAAVCCMACRASLATSDIYSAAKLGERAVEQAREAGDIETSGKAHLYLGYAYTHIGDTYAAEQNLETFLKLLPELPALEHWEGEAHHHLAIIHRQRKQWQTAIHSLERASCLFETNGRMSERAQAALDIAWCHLMLGSSAMAKPHLDLVEAHLTQYPESVLEADFICEKALYFRMEGDMATSAQLCQEIFVPDRPGVTSLQLGEAAWIMGEIALDLDQPEEARAFANLALDYAARANWPSLMNLAGTLRRRIPDSMAAGA